MSSLFAWRVWETEFKGKKIGMELRPLKSRELAELLPFFMTMGKKFRDVKASSSDKDLKLVFDSAEDIKVIFEAQEKASTILPAAARALTGIDDGWQTICEEVYYMPLVMSILTKLVELSSLGEEDRKNSERPSS